MITNIQEKILEIFRKHKTTRNGYLKGQIVSMAVSQWERSDMDAANDAIHGLVELGYISYDNDYWLKDEGYEYIYRDYSIKDTEELILNEIRKHKVGVGHLIISNWLLNMQQNAERFHFDNMNIAFENLINDGFLTVADDNRGYYLTQTGYERVY